MYPERERVIPAGEDDSDYYWVCSEIDRDYVRACFKEGKLEKDE